MELIRDLPEDATISVYKQGEFLDLCRGPHVPDSGRVGAVALLSVAGAYWRGKSDNAMLTRIYGTAFPSKKELRGVPGAHGDGPPAGPSPPGSRTGSVQLPRRGSRIPLLPSQGDEGHQRPARLLAPGAHGRRLRGDEDAHHPRADALGALGPLGQLQGQHVLHGHRRRRFRRQAHELPGGHAHLQERAALLSRLPHAYGRAGLGAPARDVGGAPRSVPRALLHPGRRPHLLPARAGGGRGSGSHRTGPQDV